MYFLLQRESNICSVKLPVKEKDIDVWEYQSIEVRSLFFYESRSQLDKLSDKNCRITGSPFMSADINTRINVYKVRP